MTVSLLASRIRLKSWSISFSTLVIFRFAARSTSLLCAVREVQASRNIAVAIEIRLPGGSSVLMISPTSLSIFARGIDLP